MRLIAFLFCYIVSFTLAAQTQPEVIVHGDYPSLYIIHRVAAKQTVYGLARAYNQLPMVITKGNSMNDDAQLKENALVNIPLSSKNFTQDGLTDKDEILVPLYYVIQPGDNLFRISQQYNKVRIDFLREWNNIAKDDVQRPGQTLIIGHLKINKENLRLVYTGLAKPNDKADEVTASNTTPTTTQPTPTVQPTTTATTPNTDEGFFYTQYPENQGKQPRLINGQAASFKTTSGWSDRKFYALMNDVEPGTIVRVTTESNGSICAKVLGPLPDMKENKGVLIRISNAAASALKMSDNKFTVTVGHF